MTNLGRGRITIIDHFGTPGDTLLTATVCRIVKRRFSSLRINCVTQNPDLIERDPAIHELNGAVGFCHLSFEYLGLLETKASRSNVLAPSLSAVGIRNYNYRARVYLSDAEIAKARERIPPTSRPIVSINVMSKERVKVWSLEEWQELVERLLQDFLVIQIGDSQEPPIQGVIPFGGRLQRRESMAMLSLASIHIGPDSFLMHAANGLDVPSVIIYGGSRPAGCFGYAENINIEAKPECSPCWLHDSLGQVCPHNMQCMKMISVEEVHRAVLQLMQNNQKQAAIATL